VSNQVHDAASDVRRPGVPAANSSASPSSAPHSSGPRKNGLFSYNNRIAVTIFIGAFLLFQVQLLVGKYLLPWFGGTPSVWTACLLFFEVLLLGGYAYSHFVAMRLPIGRQRNLHAGFLTVSVLTLIALAFVWPSPITPGAAWKPQPDGNPTLLILRFLLASVGLPFFLLSSTGPLLQHWFARRNPGVSPYRLYSLSNLGSLLGLLCYPFLLEPLLRLRTQAWLWSCCYLLFVALCVSVAPWEAAVAPVIVPERLAAEDSAAPPTHSRQMLWVALAACGSAMLLAVTNVVCQEVAVSPFLWVFPLCLYLITFILCFEYPGFYRRGPFHALFFLTAAGSCALLLRSPVAPLIPELLLFFSLMFACCMAVHGEIACTKPDPRYLTRFYLCISLGGAIGGIFVSVVAPLIFLNLWEFPITIVATGILLIFAIRQDQQSWWFRSLPWAPLALCVVTLGLIPFAGPAFGWNDKFFAPLWYWILAGGLLVVAAALYWFANRLTARSLVRSITRASAVVALCLLALGFLWEARQRLLDTLARSRNFYGVLAVVKDTSPAGDFLFLRDRMTSHGMQYTNPELARLSTGYYGPNSGVYLLLSEHPPRPIRVGLVGLGIGTLAALSRPGDYFRFYEINPDVIHVSQGSGAYFTYLRDSPGKVEVVQGDARLSLEQEASRGEFQKFDVLVLDAFSGDAIPVHLLTREAFQLYRQHLRSPSSVIAVHITNRNLDLSLVLAGIAREMHFSAIRVYRPWLDSYSSKTDWVLLSEDPASLRLPALLQAGRSLSVVQENQVWTDDYSNLLHYLK
jgi:spermidine synthase